MRVRRRCKKQCKLTTCSRLSMRSAPQRSRLGSALLHWTTTEEFGSRSGDVTETYYRCDPKDECYWQHYRGGGRGMHAVLHHMATSEALGEVSQLTLFHANLTRSSHVCQDTSGAGWCTTRVVCVCVCVCVQRAPSPRSDLLCVCCACVFVTQFSFVPLVCQVPVQP